MAEPQRIQRKRTKGWQMPEGAVYVGRPTRWGNPLPGGLKGLTAEQVVRGYRDLVVFRKATIVTADYRVTLQATDCATPIPSVDEVRSELAGKDLLCWCGPGQPCHGDVHLEIANSSPAIVRTLHAYGSRQERSDMLAIASALVREVHEVVHHWRPWQALVPLEGPPVVPLQVMPATRGAKWRNISVIAALWFVLGVVVYWTAVAP